MWYCIRHMLIRVCCVVVVEVFFFFFKQKTAYEMRISDWSSDVCSSDLLAKDVDPSEAKKQAKRVQAQSGDTFRAVAEEYVSKLTQEGRAEATLTKLEWLLSFAYPKLGRRPIRDITVPEVLEVLRRVEARGRYEMGRESCRERVGQ